MMLAFLVPSGLQRTAVSSEEVPKINAKTSLLGMHKSTVQHVFVDRRHRPRSHSLPLHQTKHVRFKNLTRTKKSWEVFQPPKPWWSFHRFPMDFQWVSHVFLLVHPPFTAWHLAPKRRWPWRWTLRRAWWPAWGDAWPPKDGEYDINGEYGCNMALIWI